MKECNCDYENAVSEGRAHFVCPKCKKDITIELVLMAELEEDIKEIANLKD